MMKRKTVYTIRASENYGGRRTIKYFGTKKEAKRELKKILSPSKRRKVNGKVITLTSYREAQSGTGINNPRIKKIKSYI